MGPCALCLLVWTAGCHSRAPFGQFFVLFKMSLLVIGALLLVAPLNLKVCYSIFGFWCAGGLCWAGGRWGMVIVRGLGRVFCPAAALGAGRVVSFACGPVRVRVGLGLLELSDATGSTRGPPLCTGRRTTKQAPKSGAPA